MACCQDELAEDIGNLFGEQLDMKEETELLEEMRRLAVDEMSVKIIIKPPDQYLQIMRHILHRPRGPRIPRGDLVMDFPSKP